MTSRTRLTVCVPLLALTLSPLIGNGAVPVLSARPTAAAPHLYGLPLSFEPNRGQVNSTVRFLAHSAAGTIFLTRTGMVLTMPASGSSSKRAVWAGDGLGLGALRTAPLRQSIVRLTFDGASANARFTASSRLPGTANYFVGNNPTRWHTDIPTYAGVEEHGLYPHIDLAYHGTAGSQLEYSWVLRPGAQLSSIRFHVSGPASLHIDGGGALVIAAGASRLIESRPAIYQPTSKGLQSVSGGFRLLGHGEIGLRVPSYDHARPLVVDPVLSYGTYLGGSDSEQGLAVAANAQGDAYVVGDTTSDNFPTNNAIQTQNLGDVNIFIGKFNPSGSAMLFSTYIGGSQSDEGLAIAVDAKGSPYVTGDTLSTDFPTVHPLQRANRTQCANDYMNFPCPNAIIMKLKPTGDGLVFSTYLGGNLDDEGNGIALDRSDNVYVAGVAYSTNFPTAHAIQPHNRAAMCPDETTRLAACSDAFIAKIDPTGQKLLYSTYLGGTSNDEAEGIAVDNAGNAYICGDTLSEDFPTANAAYPHAIRNQDAFVAALNPSGSALLYSTYLGGTNHDVCINIAVRQHSAYATGYTWSSDFPTTSGAFGRAHHGLDAFVTKFSPSGGIAYSTLVGGSKDDEAMDIAIDTHNDAYIIGDTTSTDFPVLNAAQPHNAGQTDAFITELNPTGTGLVQSTYLGGTKLDYGHALGRDSAGDVYVAGFTYSHDFPTVHALHGPAGDDDAFVGRLGNRILAHSQHH